jgi:ATP-binding cassette subfamily B (MDR/TAP) protein 1
LFRFTDKIDYFLITIGTIAAVANGAALPGFTILWGNMINSFGVSNSDPNFMVDISRGIMFQFL